MKPGEQRKILVYADWAEIGKATQVGVLTATPARSNEVFSFEYDPNWLKSGHAQMLDPGLLMFSGPQYPSSGKASFGVFLDSSPDRWGRMLMDRRETVLARQERRPLQALRESDYLLGVHDGHRMGALRFRLDPDGPFLDNDTEFASPSWVSLRELEHASLEIERRDAGDSPNYNKWLRMLIAPGGSLGGARPKAGVLDQHDNLWIAKFPSRNDNLDVGGWEYVANELARRSGVDVPDSKARTVNTAKHTFMTRRFDRIDVGKRRHFASAMTLLNRSDGDDASTGASYLELAEFLMRHGAQTDRDLEQLWRRIVFNMCISNVDDHLRNHGLLLRPAGWELSPAYDLNPVSYGDGLKLNVSDADNAQDLELAMQVADFFRVNSTKARGIIAEVGQSANLWRVSAHSIGISRSEQDRMAPAFRIADTSA
jgi:serine/threonine-protein kinase HipA